MFAKHRIIKHFALLLPHQSRFRAVTETLSWADPNKSYDSRILKFLSTAVDLDDRDGVKKTGPIVEYERRVDEGKLAGGNIGQVYALRELQRLHEELVEHADACQVTSHNIPTKYERFKNLSFWRRSSSHSPVKGLYMYGGVGTGKTMMMDLFFDQLPWNWKKQRIHFHDFMLNVHSGLQKHKSLNDPFEAVSLEISQKSIILCLDEFMVPDIAVALILNRLFKHLFNNGVILVATSNRKPENLYQGGIQRQIFLQFVATLKERCIIHEIGSSLDYRKLSLSGEGLYFIGKQLSSVLRRKFELLAGENNKTCEQEIDVAMGRRFKVPLGINGCAYFTFEELCDRPLGSADYSALFSKFHTLAVEGVPVFGPHNRPAAYRFFTLIDVMYDNKALLMCTAEGTPVQLFQKIVTSTQSSFFGSENYCADNKLAFAKDRTISRLTEMNGTKYLDQHAEKIRTISIA